MPVLGRVHKSHLRQGVIYALACENARLARADAGTGMNLCQFHHDICIHRRGWRLILHPDGTTTAYGPDGQGLSGSVHTERPPP